MPKGYRADGQRSPLLGRPRPLEIKQKIAGPRFSYNAGPNNYMFGRNHDEAARQLISERTKAKMTPEICAHLSELAKKRIGPLNSFWRGGWVNPGYPQAFSNELKEGIRVRDDYKCQRCGILQSDCVEVLHVHHIDGNRNNLADNNLISLCRKCHTKITAANRRRKGGDVKDEHKVEKYRQDLCLRFTGHWEDNTCQVSGHIS